MPQPTTLHLPWPTWFHHQGHQAEAEVQMTRTTEAKEDPTAHHRDHRDHPDHPDHLGRQEDHQEDQDPVNKEPWAVETRRSNHRGVSSRVWNCTQANLNTNG